MHLGRSLMHGVVEVWECDEPQAEVVRRTRDGVRRGLTLDQVKANLPLRQGRYAPADLRYADDLLRGMGDAPRGELDESLCAVFVGLTNWQL
jgi:hypothetical protein